VLPFLGNIQIQTMLLKFRLRCKNAKSLQVPCSNPLTRYKERCMPEKGVLPFISLKKKASASITVEAAVCLPLFVFFSLALLMPMEWLNQQRQIQTAMESLGESWSQYLYVLEKRENQEQGANQEEWEYKEEQEYKVLISDMAAGLLLKGKLSRYAENVTIKRAEVPDESGHIYIEAEFRENIPLFATPSSGVLMKAAVKRRSWIGLNGKLKKKRTGAGSEDYENSIVYVGASMGRYHWYRDCHYLSNQYESVSFEQIINRRNSFGSKYTACARCAQNTDLTETVYVTEGGVHYHLDKQCTAMVSYVRSLPLDEVRHLGACSYCERRKGSE